MAAHWWQMPGPSRFVTRVADQVRDGNNVLLGWPEHAPGDFLAALRHELDACAWRVIDAAEAAGQRPVELLYDLFARDAPPHEPRTPAGLTRQPGFGGRCLWVSGLTAATWPDWKKFIVAYAPACRAVEGRDRTLFVLPLVGRLARDLPTADACLSDCPCRGTASRLDTWLYAAERFHDRSWPHLQKQVLTAVAGQLALWDPAVVDRLAEEDWPAILEPRPVLCRLAQERGWTTDTVKGGWEKGAIDLFEHEERTHAALLALDDPGREIDRRLWTAEVSVLFPFIEERRRDLLERLGDLLRVPFAPERGPVIHDLRSLEIGHIEAQIFAYRLPVEAPVRNCVAKLKEIRNGLAHLKPLDGRLLFCRELQSWPNGRLWS